MLKGKKVLIIDDNQPVAEMLQIILEREGGSIFTEHRGASGLEKAQSPMKLTSFLKK